MKTISAFGSIAGLALCGSALAMPVQFGTNFYEFVDADGVTWQDAAAAASTFGSVGGHLATITSTAENAFLAGQFASFTGFAGA